MREDEVRRLDDCFDAFGIDDLALSIWQTSKRTGPLRATALFAPSAPVALE